MRVDNCNQTVYEYQDWRFKVFTEEGQIIFLQIRDNVQKMLKQTGAFKHTYAYGSVSSDSYTMAACIDRLVELKEIIIVSPDSTIWCDRIYTRGLLPE